MSYSPSYTDLFRRATFYTSRNGALAHEGDRRIVIREDVLDRLLPRYGARRPRSWTSRPETFRPDESRNTRQRLSATTQQ